MIRYISKLYAGLFVLLVGGSSILIGVYYPAFFPSITQNISDHVMLFRLARWGIILGFAISWSYLASLFGKYYGASVEKIAYWQGERLRVLAWFIVFELLVCENVAIKLIHFIVG